MVNKINLLRRKKFCCGGGDYNPRTLPLPTPLDEGCWKSWVINSLRVERTGSHDYVPRRIYDGYVGGTVSFCYVEISPVVLGIQRCEIVGYLAPYAVHVGIRHDFLVHLEIGEIFHKKKKNTHAIVAGGLRRVETYFGDIHELVVAQMATFAVTEFERFYQPMRVQTGVRGGPQAIQYPEDVAQYQTRTGRRPGVQHVSALQCHRIRLFDFHPESTVIQIFLPYSPPKLDPSTWFNSRRNMKHSNVSSKSSNTTWILNQNL